MDRQESSDPRGGAKPTGKSSWSKFYDSCFVQKRPFPQPSKETLSNLSDQHSPTSSGHLGEASTSDNRQGDIRRPGDDTLRNPRTPREADRSEATQEHTNLKQLVNNRLKELEETSGQTDRLLSEIQKACDEHRREDTTNQLANKILEVSNAVSTEICERSQTLQNAYKKFERDREGLEEIGRHSQELHKRVQQTIGERLLRLQDDCNELRETKDLLTTLRDFSHVRERINKAKDLSEVTREDTKIKELADGTIKTIEDNYKKISNEILNVQEGNIKEFLDNSWRFQSAWDKLKEDVNQLETLRKASREWKEARQIKEEFIGTLSEKSKGAAGMRAEMADTAFELFLSYFEQKDTRQGDKARLEQALKQLKGIVADDLKHKWKMLTESHKVLYKDHENLATSMQETTATYGQFASELGEEKFAGARELVDQLAKDILSYEFKPKEVKPSRRTKAVDRLRKLLRMTRDHRPERVNKIAGEFNDTLREVKEKLDAVPEEVKYKVIETAISMMEGFKEAYDDAVRGYGKRKGRTAREGGERKIKELNKRISEINKDLDRWHPVQEARREFEQTQSPYTVEERNSLHKYLDATIASYKRVLDAYRQGSDQSDARKQYELARQDFLEAKDQIDLRNMGKKLVEEYDSILEHIKGKEGTIEYVNNYEKYKQFICNKISTFLDKKYLYTSCKLIEEFKSTNKNVATHFKIRGFPDINIDDKLENVKRRYSDYSEKLSGANTEGKKKPNEDAHFTDEEHQVYAVFDGVTGQEGGSGGHIASAIAVDSLRQSLNQLSDDLPVENVKNNIENILRKANQEIVNNQEGNYSKMATTASIVKVMKDGSAVIGNVGDSRVYCFRKKSGSLEPLTRDDNHFLDIVKHAGGNPLEVQKRLANAENQDEVVGKVMKDLGRSLASSWDHITQCLGKEYIEGDAQTELKISISTCQLEPGDMLIIMSDGVHDNLKDNEIANYLLNNNGGPKRLASGLVEAAKQIAGQFSEEKQKMKIPQRPKPDDITAIVIRYAGKGADSTRSKKKKGKAIDESNIASTSGGQETSERDDRSNETPAERQARLFRQAGLSE